MEKKLFLLDGMALIYRAHFAFIRNPIMTSKGQNTSAIYGFANTVLDILGNHQPTHLAIAFDTREPTVRHEMFPEYKAQRDEIPEDIVFAIPHVQRMAEAFNIPVLKYPGYEADDVIGTLAVAADKEGFETYLVTPDKDFAQLVSEHVFMFKPGRQGSQVEVIDIEAVRTQWNVRDPEQVADVLGLWGDASDNIPGVPGFGEKTAKKLIGEYGTVENLIAHSEDLKGKQKERLEDNREQALLCKKLTQIIRDVPVRETLEDLVRVPHNEEALKAFFVEFEFNALGKRVLGDDFKAGRGHTAPAEQGDLFDPSASAPAEEEPRTDPDLKRIGDVDHTYRRITSPRDVKALTKTLSGLERFCFDVETDSLDPKTAALLGIALSWNSHEGVYVDLCEDPDAAREILELLRPVFLNTGIEKVGHNLKFDIGVMKWQGVEVSGPLFDTMLAHMLIEPDRRHTMDNLSEQYLGYEPIPITALFEDTKKGDINLRNADPEQVAEYAAEDADVTWQLQEVLRPELKEHSLEKVFYDIEMPLVGVLVDMEHEGVALDLDALKALSKVLEKKINGLQMTVFEKSGCSFNLNSPKQLGEVLFDRLKLVDKPKKTPTGQYATNEQVLEGLAHKHDIVKDILNFREASKLKSTYADALPEAVFEKTGRVHTTFSQAGAATGRLASSHPNLQNIPIRTEMGREIRKAFTSRGKGFTLLAADYSQIELRVMAEMSEDPGMKEAFMEGLDIHATTASRVYGTEIQDVSSDMRRTAKMVNFGIIFGISAFGLSQRLGVPRREAKAIIEQYFLEFPQVKAFMDRTIESCREKGYVETMSGRRRAIRDINSANATIRTGAERVAINSPIQGTAADMIKLAMTRIQQTLKEGGFETRMILQVHDELVFDLKENEADQVKPLIEDLMVKALPFSIPVVVDMGTGKNWLEAH